MPRRPSGTAPDAIREKDKLCIVETPADQLVIEGSHSYRGLHYVLGGRLSPVENRGPEQLGFSRLIERIKEPEVKEVILATSFTAEGDATAHYIALAVSRHRPDIRLTRLARGIPTGIELEYTDVATVAHAILGRSRGKRAIFLLFPLFGNNVVLTTFIQRHLKCISRLTIRTPARDFPRKPPFVLPVNSFLP